MIHKIVLSSMCVFFLAGCGSLAPEIKVPVVELNTVKTENLDLSRWWEKLNDPILNSLIDEVIKNNHDIKTLQYAVDIANKESAIIENYIYPTVNATLSKSRQNIGDRVIDNYASGLSILNYEVDYLGKRNLALVGSKSVLERSKNNIELEKAAIVFSIVNEYFSLKSNLKILEYLQEKQQANYALLGIAEQRFKVGLDTEEPLLAQKNATAAISVDILNRQLEIAKNKENLKVLSGNAQLSFNFTTKTEIAHNLFLKDVPSSVLESRYDIKNAELELKIKNANIGLAKAAFFPKISLTTSFGSQSNNLSGLFSGGTSVWTPKAELSLNIFNGFNDLISYEKSKIEYESSLNQYIKTVKNAFFSVQYNLSALEAVNRSKQTQLTVVTTEKQRANIIINKVKVGQLNPKESYSEEILLLNHSIAYEQAVAAENKVLFLTMKSFFG